MTSEDQLVLLLARGDFPTHVQEHVLALLATPLRWDLVLERAMAHEVYPLLYRNLRRLDFPGVPTHVRTELEALYKINAFQNVRLAEELARVLTLLEGAGIPTIPLKGVTLAESLYGDLTLRVCADIDILVPRQAVARAFDLLLAEGYKLGETYQVGSTEIDLLLDSNIEYMFVYQRQGFLYLLELHWDIAWRGQKEALSMGDLWAETRPKVLLGVEAHGLSPEWDLLYLAVHVARHRWGKLKWLVDIHEICSRGEINWAKVTDKANVLGSGEVVRITLSACHALFETRIPIQFSPDGLPSWIKLFPADSSPSNIWRDALFPASLLKRPSDRLRYVIRVLLVPTLAERRLLRLPSCLGFLYYPLRPLRLGCKWGWQQTCAGFQKLRSARFRPS